MKEHINTVAGQNEYGYKYFAEVGLQNYSRRGAEEVQNTGTEEASIH